MKITHRPRRVVKAITTIEFQGHERPDLWHHMPDRSVALNDDVLQWLATHSPGFKVAEPDRGDWGEGTPNYKITVKNRGVAAAFVKAFPPTVVRTT